MFLGRYLLVGYLDPWGKDPACLFLLGLLFRGCPCTASILGPLIFGSSYILGSILVPLIWGLDEGR